MKKHLLSIIFISIFSIVFGQYKDGQAYFKLKPNSSIGNLERTDAVKFSALKSTFMVRSIHPAFPHIQDGILDLIYTIDVPLSVDEDALVKALQGISIVDYAEKVPTFDLSFTPNDPLINQQWYLGSTYVNAFNAWNISTGSTAVKLAIVDDEVRITHEDLQPKIYTNTAEIAGNGIDDDNNGYIDDRNGWDAGDNDNNPNRPLSAPAGSMIHGTHCAGIAAAATNNAKGIASIGYGVSLIPVKVNRDANTGNSLDNPYGGVEYAIAAKANVVSMSWGGGAYSQTGQLLFDYGHSQGIVFVAAAGNSSSSSPHYPSAYNHVIAVAASTTGDLKSGFSNYGAWVDITAPGSNIYSCIGNADNTYGMLSGTSMACPMVAGLCALMLSNSPSLTPDALESCLKLSADNIDAKNPSYIGQLGAGRINALNALKCLPCLAKASFNIGSNNQQNYAVNSNISFTSTGFGNSYQWILNGVVTSTLPSFSKLFNTKGNYTIQLVALDNAANCRDTVTKYFTVFDSIPTVCRPLQDANWYFGVNAGVSFLTDPPTVMSGNVNMVNGSSTLSNDCGGMQFYSDGLTIWDKNGTAMPNGTGLFGSTTACRSAMIIPKTDSAGVYYVFTIDYNGGSRGLRYSIVDLRLPGNGTVLNPFGDVRVKNILVESRACEKQNAILHANGKDYWLITHDCNNNNFYSVLVTSTSVMPSIASNIANENFANNSTDGEIEFSPDGTKMATTFFQNTTHNLSVYSFDRSTGLISPTTQVIMGDPYNDCAYGLEFSPDCSKLYATTMCIPALYQYDFNTATLSLIATDVKNNPYYGFGEMKLAPNNKIYVNRWGYSTMGVIHNPNAAGLACNYCSNTSGNCGSLALTGLQLSSGASMKAGISGSPKTTFGGCNLSFQHKDSCVNYPVSFTTVDPIRYCKGATRYEWNFGDTSSTSNSSTQQNPSHVFSKTGNFLVTLRIINPCDTVSISKTVTIICCSTDDNVVTTNILCLGDTAQLVAPHLGSSYLWAPTTYLSNPTIANPKASPSVTTVYVVRITGASGCIYFDTVKVAIAPKSNFTITESKQCGSDTLSIIPTPQFYAWNSGQINKPLTVTQSGDYWVIARNTYGCYDTLHVLVDVNSSSSGKIKGDTLACIGDSVLLTFNVGAINIVWTTGATNDSIFVKSTGWYGLTYTQATCNARDSIYVRFVTKIMSFDIGKDTSFCGPFIKTLSTAPANSLWSTGVSAMQLAVNTPGLYWAEQTNVCGSFRDSILITQKALPIFSLGSDSNICVGDSLNIGTTFAYDSLLWSFGNQNLSQLYVHGGNYWLELYKDGCKFRDSIQVIEVTLPVFALPLDTQICENEKLFLIVPSALNFVWEDGSKLQNRTVTEAGQYWITIFLPCGNYNDTINVTTESCECKFVVPTAFSPNKDGVNDMFRVLSTCALSKFRLSVYNRWGEKVFESNDFQFGWNGMYKNELQPMGTYVWTCSYYDNFEKRQKEKVGNVTIIR